MRFIRVLAFAAALPAFAAAEPAEERSVVAWMKTFAAAPVDAGAAFEAPDYHGSLIEAAARRAMSERLAALGYQEDAAASGPLTLSVSVTAPPPKGRKGLPQSPIRIASEDIDPFDNIHDPELRAEWVNLPKGSRRPGRAALRVTIYARRGDERVWAVYAGADLDGASREDVAAALASALIDHFGESADIESAAVALPAGAPAITIVEPAGE